MMPKIPLCLAKISAKVLLPLRGLVPGHIQFYSWVWVSGKHGGPRLFHPSPGSVHVLVLGGESGYLHTVGDYPAYDLEIHSRSLPGFIAAWHAGYAQDGTLMERIVAVRLKAELESLLSRRAYVGRETWELQEFTSTSFIEGQLNSLCHSLSNPLGREEACAALAESISRH